MSRKWGDILKEKSAAAIVTKPTWFAERVDKIVEAAEQGRWSVAFSTDISQAECDSLYIYCRHEGLKFYATVDANLGGRWKLVTISWSEK